MSEDGYQPVRIAPVNSHSGTIPVWRSLVGKVVRVRPSSRIPLNLDLNGCDAIEFYDVHPNDWEILGWNCWDSDPQLCSHQILAD